MKRIYYFLTMLMMAAAPMTFTSCDTDDDPWYDDYYGNWYDDYDWYDDPFDHGNNDLVSMAQTLNGTWTGTLTNEYTDNSGQRQQTNCYVDFSFIQYTSTSVNGNGYETDYVPSYDDNGNVVRDNNGNIVYDSQTLQFKWYVDPRTYNIYIEYSGSGYTYKLDHRNNSATSGFYLGYDDKSGEDIFSGVMEGTNNNEYIFFDCARVTANAPRKAAAKNATASKLSFGKAKGLQRVKENVAMGLHKR